MEKKGPFQEIEIQQPEMIGEVAIVKKFSAMVTDAKDQAVYNAILDAAKKAGINSLLLMDRRFVLNALEVAIKRQEMLDSCSEAPTIEAEPVVRCKECANWDKEWVPSMYTPADEVHFCHMIGICTCNDFFCAYGEKMDLEG